VSTNKAILNVIAIPCHQNFRCRFAGEGWLNQKPYCYGKVCGFGLDAIPQLLENAKKKRRKAPFTDVIRKIWFGKFHNPNYHMNGRSI